MRKVILETLGEDLRQKMKLLPLLVLSVDFLNIKFQKQRLSQLELYLFEQLAIEIIKYEAPYRMELRPAV